MQKQDFNRGWYFYRDGNEAAGEFVNLPHDAMIHEKRDCENTAGLGYFPGGKYGYTKRFTVPEECREKTLLLEFEGVYRHADVFVNGQKAAHWAYGYTGFFVSLQPYLHYGEENEIRVIADNAEQPNSRWYSGSGIYRKVNLWIGGRRWIGPEDVFITTKSCDPAVISIDIQERTARAACGEEALRGAAGQDPHELMVETQVIFDGRVVAMLEGRRGELEIPDARLWSENDPAMYTARVTLRDAEGVMDVQEVSFGIRTLSWNAKDGLLVNGVRTKLRGACIHHDNGVIGACAFDMAEERKIRILKEAGFNAIRSAHNPCSKAMLDACDKYGMYVMDEAFDAWYIPKNSKDYAMDFEEWHEKDLAAMIRKDFNHPSVILYSLGNETIETARQKGVELVADMRRFIRKLDASRPVTCGISITQNIDEYQGKASAKEQHMGGVEKKQEEKKQENPMAAVTPEMLAGVNMYMEKLGRDNEEIAGTQIAEEAIRDVCQYLDIPGYNYGECKTEYDSLHNPDRVVVSSETHHTQIAEHWELIEKTPHLIGDFMWTGWDYIGEAGIGALGYPSRGGIGFDKPYPYLTGACGIIDITGFLRPEVYWTQMAWHMRTEPVIAVEPVERAGEPYMMTYWNDTEAVSGWSWDGLEGREATVKVYSPQNKAELFLNGRSLGSRPVLRNMAVFKLPYEPGELVAKTYDEEGKEAGTAKLTSAGKERRICVETENAKLGSNGQDLAWLKISVTDDAGTVHIYPDREILVTVTGAGSLQGLGSGAIFTEDSFTKGSCHTFYGRALAVVRAGYEPGEIRVKICCGDLVKEVVLECVRKEYYGRSE